ncbi:MAG: 8-amino-7-oxononanoate synthase [Bacteroidetes bacterium]|nr:MAG: 8-amino-7-oxononanoate synthase [Bacteroidota bacterium]
MLELQKRAINFGEPRRIRDSGLYPYFKVLQSGQDKEVVINGKKVLMFGSNNYLGLTSHPKIKEAAIAAINKYGSGTAGSRFLNGTLDIHLELEKKLADFVGKEDAITFSTGFQTNLGAIGGVIDRKDCIIIDEQDHASLIDGTRLTFGKVYKYKHNDMESLEKVLIRQTDYDFKLIVMDGIFSMEGDIAKLDEIAALAKKYNAVIMVDDAHGLGVLGKNGRGTANHFGVTDDVELITGTFSKSLATVGGFIAATKEVIDFLRHTARSFIFSASLPPAATASVIAALDVIEETPEIVDHLWENTDLSIKLFNHYGIDIGKSETPIIPIYVRDNEKTFILTKMLLDQGIFVNPVISPAVPPEHSLLRFSLMSTHTKDQIEYTIEKIYTTGKQIGIFQ